MAVGACFYNEKTMFCVEFASGGFCSFAHGFQTSKIGKLHKSPEKGV